jgi:replicative DNA helicase
MEAPQLEPSHLPPQNLDAERSVLGGVLLDNEALHDVVEIVRSEDFYRESHRQIFEAMVGLSLRMEPIDVVTLAEELRARGQLDAAGGPAALAALDAAVPAAAHIAHYAKITRDKAVSRRLIAAAHAIAARAYEQEGSTDELLDEAERLIFEVSQQRKVRDFAALRALIPEAFKEVEKLHERGDEITGVATGYPRLDEFTSGLQKSDLVIVAGRPSMGKTTLVMNIAAHIAVKRGMPVAMFSLEMSSLQLAMRLLASESRIDSQRLRTGKLLDQDWERLAHAAGKLADAPIFIDDTAGINALELRAKARRLQSRVPGRQLGLVIVDYLQLMRGHIRTDSREREISEVTRSLKSLAKELQVPVVALSQLNRALEARTDKRPQLSDLRECVTGETLVVLADGRRVPVRELVGTTPSVLAVSDDGRIVSAHSDRVWSVGKREVFAVRLASGRAVRATAKHRLLCGSGWKRVSEMRPGDRVALAREFPEPKETLHWPDARVALLGQLIGDGSYLRGQPMRYTTASEENSEMVARAAREEFGAEVKRYAGRRTWHQLLISGNGNRWRPAGVNLWLRELGIFGQRSHEKRAPASAFRLSNAQIGLLLRHLWATDGTISPRREGTRGGHGVHFSTNSAGLAQDVAALLLRLGIVARTYLLRQGKYRPLQVVAVSGAADQQRFLERVGAFGPRREPAERLRRALRGVEPNTNVDTLPEEVFADVKARMRERGVSQRKMATLRGTSYGGTSHFHFAPSRSVLAEYAEILDDDALRAHATSDLFWDRVVSIEPAGEEEVFDLTVPGPASWLADGIVSHNSGAIEQDADVICFVYREEVYVPKDDVEKLKEVEGRAELIIGKQRNGPIGVVPLTFLKQYTRFESTAEGM